MDNLCIQITMASEIKLIIEYGAEIVGGASFASQTNEYLAANYTREELIVKISNPTRAFQDKHGKKADDTQAAHHLNHSDMEKMIRSSSMTNLEIVELGRFVDQSTIIQDKSHNQHHTRLENQIKGNGKNGTDMDFEAKNRIFAYLDRIATGLSKEKISVKNADRMIKFYSKNFFKNKCVLQQYSECFDGKKAEADNRTFLGLVDSNLYAADNDLSMYLRPDQLHLTKDGKFSEKSALVEKGFLKFKGDKTVDERCLAYRRNIVDKNGVYQQDHGYERKQSEFSVDLTKNELINPEKILIKDSEIKVINPLTGRQISTEGQVYKNLVKDGIFEELRSKNDEVKRPTDRNAESTTKQTEKVLNSLTGRQISTDGQVYKNLVKDRILEKQINTSTVHNKGDGTPDGRFSENKKKSKESGLRLKDDGTLDMRFTENKELVAMLLSDPASYKPQSFSSAIHLTKNLEPDMRFKENKAVMNGYSNGYSSQPLSTFTTAVHLSANKTPDMRFKVNKEAAANVAATANASSYDSRPSTSYTSPATGIHLKGDQTPDMRYKENKIAANYSSPAPSYYSPLQQSYSASPAPAIHLKADQTPDMRFTANKIAAASYSSPTPSYSAPQQSYSAPSRPSTASAPGRTNNNGTPDRRFKANK